MSPAEPWVLFCSPVAVALTCSMERLVGHSLPRLRDVGGIRADKYHSMGGGHANTGVFKGPCPLRVTRGSFRAITRNGRVGWWWDGRGQGTRLAGLPAPQSLCSPLLSLQVLVLGEQVVKNPQGGFEIQVHHICGRKRRHRWRGKSP